MAALIKNDVGIEAAQVDIGGWDTHSAQDPIAGSMFKTMQDFSNSLAAFYADVIATRLQRHGRRGVGVRPQRARERQRRHGPRPRHGDVRDGKGDRRRPRADEELAGAGEGEARVGQDLKVTVDYKDILAEIVQKRLANPNLDFVFPTWTPTMLGVTR